jgi:hypothetical protein
VITGKCWLSELKREKWLYFVRRETTERKKTRGATGWMDDEEIDRQMDGKKKPGWL